jgi:hypothetical protein
LKTQDSQDYSYLFAEKSAYIDSFRIKKEVIGPQVLIRRHLRVSFVIIFGLLAVSVVAFAAECAPRETKKLLNLFLGCYIVMKFTRMKKNDADCRSL